MTIFLILFVFPVRLLSSHLFILLACVCVCVCVCVCLCVVTQLTLCGTVDYGTPGSSVHGILRARILEGIAIPFSRGIFPTQG